jgi:DNA-binding MarR family transcriptional regulator
VQRDQLIETAIDRYGETFRLVTPTRIELWANLGLTLPKLMIMSIVGENGPQPVGALAERLGVTPAAVTGVVDSLEKLEFVQRRPRADDRRYVEIHLTEAGRRAVDEVSRRGRQLLATLFEKMDDQELAAFIAAQESLLRAASEAEPTLAAKG